MPEQQVLMIAGYHPITTDQADDHVAEPHTPYHIGPRARLDAILDELDDIQIEALTTFLETL